MIKFGVEDGIHYARRKIDISQPAVVQKLRWYQPLSDFQKTHLLEGGELKTGYLKIKMQERRERKGFHLGNNSIPLQSTTVKERNDEEHF